MAIILDEQGNDLLDEMGNEILDEFGSAPITPVKNPAVWIPQPDGYGYVTNANPMVTLTTNLGVALTTNLGVKLTTSAIKVTGKFPGIWTSTGA